MGVQSSSHLQMENEEFERAVMLLTNFIIWELMLTVVYSGGCKFFEVHSSSSHYCLVLARICCSLSKHVFGKIAGKKTEIKLFLLGCKHLQAIQVDDLMLTYEFSH